MTAPTEVWVFRGSVEPWKRVPGRPGSGSPIRPRAGRGYHFSLLQAKFFLSGKTEESGTFVGIVTDSVPQVQAGSDQPAAAGRNSL
ncbi:MAG: hypothetical protein DRH04_11705 [Deltaproteobacteria bacterium]|nr:MAG: hypothetical protein DRH04_11705 [Deltaproteobacteria bacterium]